MSNMWTMAWKISPKSTTKCHTTRSWKAWRLGHDRGTTRFTIHSYDSLLTQWNVELETFTTNMAYSPADDVDQNVNRGEKSEEVILHHSLTRFRMHHRHAESPHGQQIGGDVFAWTADWRYGGAFINAR